MIMRSWLSAVLASTLVVACGVPQEKHDEALNTIKKLKAELSAERKAWDETRAEFDTKNNALTQENKVMKHKLVGLGQDLSKMQTEAGQMVQNLSAKEKQIVELQKAQEAARKRAAMYQKLVASFQKMIDSGKLKVGIRNGRMVVQLSDKILFDSGKAKLKKEGSAALLDIANVLKSIANRNFQVAGHTDNIPIKTRRFKSNWELSTARAVQVVKFMASNGMDPKRISAAGYAENDPVADNAADEGRKQNRRIEITLMPSIDELPKIPKT
ncbi:MAG: OmpA family protein [Deltaproteobacteria bacterium]|nr:OmpA family protein [Deltaproteobacteria bacterium]